jgi:inorganic pyrophosphatase
VVAKAVGLFKMADEKGPDDHVVCVPCDDPGWAGRDAAVEAIEKAREAYRDGQEGR